MSRLQVLFIATRNWSNFRTTTLVQLCLFSDSSTSLVYDCSLRSNFVPSAKYYYKCMVSCWPLVSVAFCSVECLLGVILTSVQACLLVCRLNRFPAPAVGTNWPFCVKHQSINQSILVCHVSTWWECVSVLFGWLLGYWYSSILTFVGNLQFVSRFSSEMFCCVLFSESHRVIWLWTFCFR